uniref:Uncharacterized protein n=1 Tax=viral metagenome TaxID=1070528 RepID=A0A6M3XHY7_9ZZZZ
MIDKRDIKKWQTEGRVIVSEATFKKSVKCCWNEEGNAGYLYKGNHYKRADWLLTYGHEQFEELIP